MGDNKNIKIEPGHPESGHLSLGVRLRNYLLAGLVVTAPVGITLWLAWVFVDSVDSLVQKILPASYHPDTYLPFHLPGFGLLITVVVLMLIGFVAASFMGKLLIRLGEAILDRMPIIRTVYGALKQIFETVVHGQKQAFRQVVLIEYPRRGIWSVGFLTSESTGEVQNLTTEDMVNVFLPTTPNPTSGFLLFLPRRDVHVLTMTIEDGIKMVVSGGIITPPDLRPKEQRETPVIGPLDLPENDYAEPEASPPTPEQKQAVKNI